MVSKPVTIFKIKGSYEKAGGPETLLEGVLKQFDRTLINPIFVLLKRSGTAIAPVLKDVPRVELEWNGLFHALSTARALARLCKKESAALIHSHDMRSNLVGFLLTRFYHVPWIAHVHGWHGKTQIGRYRLYEMMDGFFVRFADRVLVGSYAAKKDVEALGISPVQVVPNSVEPRSAETYADGVKALRQELSAGDNTVVIGVVGRIHPGKGQAVLLRAVKKLLDKALDLRVLIVGEGPELDALTALAAELGIEEQVKFAGFCTDAYLYMAAMDIFVVPSLKESLPLTALEAMGMGRAIVASRVGDLPVVIEDGVNGLLVEPGNVADLSAAIEKLVRNSDYRNTLGERGSKVIREHYSMASMAKNLEDIYLNQLTDNKN